MWLGWCGEGGGGGREGVRPQSVYKTHGRVFSWSQ